MLIFRALLLTLLFAFASSINAAPRLIFLTQLNGAALISLASDSMTIWQLRQLEAGVRIGISDMGDKTARAIQMLDSAHIPVSAWLLPASDMPAFTMANSGLAISRYEAFKAWSAQHGLKWTHVSISIMSESHTASWATVYQAGKRFYDPTALWNAQAAYQSLVHRIRTDGYTADVYAPSIMIDERRAGTTAFQRLSGLPSIKGDRDIPALLGSYTTDENSAFLLYSYAQEQQVKALLLGPTGSASWLPKGMATVSAEQLLQAAQWIRGDMEEIHIFSLEGCIVQGMLPKLKQLNFASNAPRNALNAEDFRNNMRNVLSLLEYPWAVATAILLMAFILLWSIWKIISRIFF